MVFVFSVLFGAFIGIFFLWFSSKNAVKDYPELRIHAPEGAKNSPEWQAWAQENGYKLNDKGVWAKGTGMLTSATEIRFEGNDMLVQECINFLLGINRFAINAPILAGKPVRMVKIKALNKLMAQWNLPEIVFGNPEDKVRIKN
ncbi:hypothetical protein A7P85_02610 [Eikenella corrodens]|uniref:Uncharacterized protein n=1 Tax=Eikenella corrodens TaxID=539 RepID=A0A1A9RF79_EIKCO|nr:hypothetical protein [Eikenella corrodens]OAM17260.1 hypothetical protein A7P85_02610 [Eikenella corrodens]OAM23903.1 hypothetical protein A7P92_05385 [Eikenella corrodens]